MKRDKNDGLIKRLFARKTKKTKDDAIDSASYGDVVTKDGRYGVFETRSNVLFEAFIQYQARETRFYFVIKDGDKYYFKYGVSLLGVPINPDEDNRLCIIVKNKDYYSRFKKEIYKTNRCNWVGTEVSKHHDVRSGPSRFYGFNFLDDHQPRASNELHTNEDKTFQEIMCAFFEQPIECMETERWQHTCINSFNINKQTVHHVIHDMSYNLYDPQECQQPELNDSEIDALVNDFESLGEKHKASEKLMCDCIIGAKAYDLIKEALFIDKFKSYPQKLIVVEGWTAKDLIESRHFDLIPAYYALSLLRIYTDCGKESLKNSLFEDCYRLFGGTVVDPNRKQAQQKQSESNKTQQDNNQAVDKDQSTDNNSDGQTRSPTGKINADSARKFLSTHTVPMIQQELGQYIIGQDELVKKTAIFIYYHILRQLNPKMKIRPMLISGPSGSGKTEVWRVAKKLYPAYLRIEIVDGSVISQDGWSGQVKVPAIIASLNASTILVVDEFDKLASPSFSASKDNVSEHIQAEFLKLLEGDYSTIGFRSDRNERQITYDTNTLGIVLVGAFEKIRGKKESANDCIGFIKQQDSSMDSIVEITDEDLVDFGVVPELVGRISDKCTTNKLTSAQYLEIIKNKNSNVSVLINELTNLGINVEDTINDQMILDLTEKSYTNMMGVRWVSSQIESKLLESLANADLRDKFAKTETKKDAPSHDEFY